MIEVCLHTHQIITSNGFKANSGNLLFFNDFPSELVTEIFSKMDYPAQVSFSSTCKVYRKLLPSEHIDPIKFADEAARLSYFTLLTYTCESMNDLSIQTRIAGVQAGFFYYQGNPSVFRSRNPYLKFLFCQTVNHFDHDLIEKSISLVKHIPSDEWRYLKREAGEIREILINHFNKDYDETSFIILRMLQEFCVKNIIIIFENDKVLKRMITSPYLYRLIKANFDDFKHYFSLIWRTKLSKVGFFDYLQVINGSPDTPDDLLELIRQNGFEIPTHEDIYFRSWFLKKEISLDYLKLLKALNFITEISEDKFKLICAKLKKEELAEIAKWLFQEELFKTESLDEYFYHFITAHGKNCELKMIDLFLSKIEKVSSATLISAVREFLPLSVLEKIYAKTDPNCIPRSFLCDIMEFTQLRRAKFSRIEQTIQWVQSKGFEWYWVGFEREMKHHHLYEKYDDIAEYLVRRNRTLGLHVIQLTKIPLTKFTQLQILNS